MAHNGRHSYSQGNPLARSRSTRDYTLKWILWWRFRKAIHRPGGWGGTDRLGALYEWRVIRPQLHETMFADQLQSLLRSSNQGS